MLDSTSEAISAWFESIFKGEHPGHPFRGNRYTNGVSAGKTHDSRPGTETFNYAQYLDSAKSAVMSASTALRTSDYGEAMRQLNEAAYHSSQAASKLQNPGGYKNKNLGNEAKENYSMFHHAGNLCEIANKAIHDYARAVKQNATQEEIQGLRTTAESARATADSAVDKCMQALTTIDNVRVSTGDPSYSATPAPTEQPVAQVAQ